MLWLALTIPALPLTVFERAQAAAEPLAITEGKLLTHANAAARIAGVRPGMKPAAALALQPQLRLRARGLAKERAALEQLAAWALQFTSWVSPQPPLGLLLEIEGSLRLFGGLERLLQRIRTELDALGYESRLAVGPTPTGAWLLNRGGDERPALGPAGLQKQLEELPYTVLELDMRQLQALQGLGIRSVRDCLHLPRAGLSRRLGPPLLAQLDRALGRIAEPRAAFRPAPRFHSRLELPAPVIATEPLLFALHRLLLELAGFLRGIDSGIQSLTITLGSERQRKQTLQLGMLSPTRDPHRLLLLARERLAQTPLDAPAHEIALHVEQILPFTPAHADLLDSVSAKTAPVSELLERFGARLGHDAVQGVLSVAEHRPERAWDYSCPGTSSTNTPPRLRPLWLLPQPQRLSLQQGCPCWHGPLVLQEGPERIEGGWWDGDDISRDYYIARNPHRQRIWIYRERRGRREWYLHGLFA
jgi:protein ImuB